MSAPDREWDQRLFFGVDYYPEHWPRQRWETDAALMQAAGFNVVRLAEFAWALLEPAEGRFEFRWLDDAIAVLARRGLRVVLGTPTCAPPPWLVHQNPGVLQEGADGIPLAPGSRRHYCANDPAYRAHTERIVTAMARHYADHPAVIAWQIDNEFGCHDTGWCWCDDCAAAFRTWLRQRYGTLDRLNGAWGAVFWGQMYTDWEQILPPRRAAAEHNPSYLLDYRRFCTDSWVSYLDLQLGILRAECPQHPVTHNLMGVFEQLDYFKLGRRLDWVAWDNYWRQGQTQDANCFDHDIMRAAGGGRPIWVIEQQCGPVNWDRWNPVLPEGQVRLWTYHDLAHGCNGVLYFRWRACRFGSEQMHSGLLRHDASPTRAYAEARAIGAELRRLEPVIAPTRTQGQAALLFDYEQLWALQIQPHRQGWQYSAHARELYSGLRAAGVGVDLLPPGSDLSGYRLAVAPAMHLADPETVARIGRWVEAGGTLVLTARSGVKDMTGIVTDLPLPGLWRTLVGATVVEYESVPPGESRRLRVRHPEWAGLGEPAGTAAAWCDALQPVDAMVLADYADGPCAGLAAVTLARRGAGQVVYAGALGEGPFHAGFCRWLAAAAGLAPELRVPPGVEVLTRADPATGRRLLFVLNHTAAACSVELPARFHDHLAQVDRSGRAELPPLGVWILAAAEA